MSSKEGSMKFQASSAWFPSFLVSFVFVALQFTMENPRKSTNDQCDDCILDNNSARRSGVQIYVQIFILTFVS